MKFKKSYFFGLQKMTNVRIFIILFFRYQKKNAVPLSVTRSLLYAEQRTGWNAKMFPKKSAVKSLTRSVNKYLGKNVKRPRNPNVNKFVSLYIGVKFVNCDQ